MDAKAQTMRAAGIGLIALASVVLGYFQWTLGSSYLLFLGIILVQCGAGLMKRGKAGAWVIVALWLATMGVQTAVYVVSRYVGPWEGRL